MKSLESASTKCVSFAQQYDANVAVQQQKRGFKSFKSAFVKLKNKLDIEKGTKSSARVDLSDCNATGKRLNGRRHTMASIKDTPQINERSLRPLKTSFSFTEDMAAILDNFNIDFSNLNLEILRDTNMEDGCLTTTLCSTEL